MTAYEQIEALVDKFEYATRISYQDFADDSDEANRRDMRTALLAAVKALVAASKQRASEAEELYALEPATTRAMYRMDPWHRDAVMRHIATLTAQVAAYEDAKQGQAAEILHYQREFHRYKDQVAALAEDAERYRWLRTQVEDYDGFGCLPDIPYPAPIPDVSPFDKFDSAIDAAMREGR